MKLTTTDEKIAASRSDGRAARSVEARAGVRGVQANGRGIYSCSPPGVGRTTGKRNDNLIPKRRRADADNQPDAGVSNSLLSPLLPAKDCRCGQRGSYLICWRNPSVKRQEPPNETHHH